MLELVRVVAVVFNVAACPLKYVLPVNRRNASPCPLAMRRVPARQSFEAGSVEQIAFKTPAPALTAQANCARAYAAASHADAWLAEHFQKQNVLRKGQKKPGEAGFQEFV
jgi:hypothetical protein